MKRRRKPIAERQLTWTDASREERHTVRLRLWAPQRFGRHFICDYAVDGLPRPVRSHTLGGDSLHALQLALVAIRLALQPYAERLTWDDSRWIGMPYSFDLPDHRDEQQRLERLVEDEIERYFTRVNAPLERRLADNRTRYDGDSAPMDYARCTTEAVVSELRAASAAEAAHIAAHNAEAAFVFSQKRWPMIAALRTRADFTQVLRRLTALTNESDRPLRHQAALMLWGETHETAALELLRDEGVDPEATQLRSFLRFLEKNAKRPKPWDGRDA